jgi:hypothetical protein
MWCHIVTHTYPPQVALVHMARLLRQADWIHFLEFV